MENRGITEMDESVVTRLSSMKNEQEYRIGPWLVRTTQSHILNSIGIERETFESKLGLASTPEMIWADNRVSLVLNGKVNPGSCKPHSDGENEAKFEFNALDALKQVDKNKAYFKIPAADQWLNSLTEEFSSARPYDWTFSTAYDGTLAGNWIVQSTNESLDQAFIRSRDPILLYGNIDLFEDELGDNGISMLNAKIRVMSSGFFVLQRFFLRIDECVLRVWDTRLQWRIGDKYLLREVKRMDSEQWLPSMVGIDPNGAAPLCTRLVEQRFEKLYPGTSV